MKSKGLPLKTFQVIFFVPEKMLLWTLWQEEKTTIEMVAERVKNFANAEEERRFQAELAKLVFPLHFVFCLLKPFSYFLKRECLFLF